MWRRNYSNTRPTNFESFVEIYAKYFKITNKAINIEEQNSVPILLRDKMTQAVEKITNSVPI